MSSSTIAAKVKKPGAKTSEPVITLTIASETWRFRAYVAFWGMCAFAIMLAKFVVTPRLLAGPEDGSTCAPFERVSNHIVTSTSTITTIKKKPTASWHFMNYYSSPCPYH